MKFEYIKQVDEPVMSYGQMVMTGDIVELDGHFAAKAKKNISCYRVYEEPEVEQVKPRRGRPPKNPDGNSPNGD